MITTTTSQTMFTLRATPNMREVRELIEQVFLNE